MLNKKRSGDDNVGKLIILAITIVIAVGLVALVSNFSKKSKTNNTNLSLLSSVHSKWDKLQYVKTNEGNIIGEDICDCDHDDTGSGRVIYNPVNKYFTMTGITANDDCKACFNDLGGISITDSGSSFIEYNIK